MTSRPFVLMIAGPNGSGKTTLTEELRRQGVAFGAYINADEIAATLSGDYGARVRQAQALAEAARERCLSERASFTFETVMSHPSKPDILARARAVGFDTLLYFVATDDPRLNVARVRQRVALGGHAVPEDRIVARYTRTLDLLPVAVAHADHVVLFDNTRGATPADPILLRPFARFDVLEAPAFTLAPPVPDWGQAAVHVLENRRSSSGSNG